MKILLFGEYSGLFNCLKDGFKELGHEVFLASDGNEYKNYPSDFRWDFKYRFKKISKVYEIQNVWFHRKMFVGFDVVLIMAPDLFSQYASPNRLIYEFIKKNNDKVYLIGAGDTPVVFDYWYNKTEDKYHHYMAGYLLDCKNPKKFRYNNNIKLRNWELELIDLVDGYIPIWYEYAEPFRANPKMKKTIPIPINLSQFQYQPNIVKDKIVFFHGKSRSCKGGRFIIPAFEKMRENYSDVARFEYSHRLPFNEYIELINSTNVVVDDANSYSVAMNALFSMAKGKIVMGGAEPQSNIELNYKFNPIVNIHPDANNIVENMISLIENKSKIEEMGYLSRKFVEEHHDYINVAQQYIDLFNNSTKFKVK